MTGHDPIDVLFLCTGNATRSVLAGECLKQHRPDLRIVTAGTLVVEGLPLSVRTRAAFEAIGLDAPFHRASQATSDSLAMSRLIVGLDPEHVRWVRREHPAAAERATTLVHLTGIREQQGDGAGFDAVVDTLYELIPAVRVLGVEEEIPDPGGGPVEGYVTTAHRIKGLVDRLGTHL